MKKEKNRIPDPPAGPVPSEVVALGLDALRKAGADKAQADLVLSEKSELNVEGGAITLLRTTINARLTLAAIADSRWGSITVNGIDGPGVEAAAAKAVAFARASAPDPAYDISPSQPAESFGYGPREPDLDVMHEHLEAFLDRTRTCFPTIRLDQCVFDFTLSRSCFGNTQGVSFLSETGLYSFGTGFLARDGKKVSSYNGSGAAHRDIDLPLDQWADVDELMRQTTEQIDCGRMEGKHAGELVITPACLAGLVESIASTCLSDQALIRGTSPMKGSLGASVAAPLLTLRSCPVSADIQAGYFVTTDGFKAGDSCVIDAGVLRDFCLSLYGSRKTGLAKAPNAGGCWVVDPGQTPLADMIKGVQRGLLLGRMSGADPSPNGDFTAVAKNSYLIEGGAIVGPVTETMIAGNLGSLLLSISAVSRERVDYGQALLPWVRAAGVTIAGK
jgi:PmbA protein